jgi:hypothetical protein
MPNGLVPQVSTVVHLSSLTDLVLKERTHTGARPHGFVDGL